MILDKIVVKYELFISIIILVSTLTAYAIIPAVPATVPSYLFILFFIAVFILFPINSPKYKTTLFQFGLFVCVFVIYCLISQLSNWLLPVTIPQDIVLINSTNSSPLLFRSTIYTQSAYLICNVFLYLAIKNYHNLQLLNPLKWTFRLLMIYGIYELVYFLIFHTSGDFISNRIYSNETDGVIGGSFQIQTIASIDIFRMKGYTGEPSMFAFALLPYFALMVGMKRKWEAALSLCCLILSFSTTAYLGLLIYMLYQIFFSSDKRLRYTIIAAISLLFIGLLILVLTNKFIQELLGVMFFDKLSGRDMSGSDRSSFFLATFNFWKNSDILHLLFGYGYGYSRSTDFFSTLLFNVGLLGFLTYTLFIFSHFLINIPNKRLRDSYRAAIVIIYFVMMSSVPEIAYCGLWVILATGYILKDYA